MSSPSPYGPDRSLFHAVILLMGGLIVAAGGFYVLSMLGGGLSQRSSSRLTGVRYGGQAPGPAVAYRSRGFSARRGMASPDPSGSRAPAWADGGARSAPVRPPSGGSYDLNVDLGQAQLGSAPQGETVWSGNTGSSAPMPKQTAPPVADLGSSYRSSSGSAGQAWRSELSQLNGRLRALDGALAHLDPSSGGHGASASSPSSRDGATTASGPQTSARDVPSPPTVPIDDHLPWLLAAGLLWGVWRLRG